VLGATRVGHRVNRESRDNEQADPERPGESRRAGRRTRWSTQLGQVGRQRPPGARRLLVLRQLARGQTCGITDDLARVLARRGRPLRPPAHLARRQDTNPAITVDHPVRTPASPSPTLIRAHCGVSLDHRATSASRSTRTRSRNSRADQPPGASGTLSHPTDQGEGSDCERINSFEPLR